MRLLNVVLPVFFVAGLCAASEEEPDGGVYRIETRLYEVDQLAMGSRDIGTGPAEEWIGRGEAPPDYATMLKQIYLAPKAGEEVCVSIRSETVQYFERRPDCLYELKFDEAFVGYDLSLRVTPSEQGEDCVRVRVRLELSEVTRREPIEGVALDVGRPVISSREYSADLVVKPGEWYQTVNPSAGISTLLLALRVYPFDVDALASQLAPPQYTIETGVHRFPDGAFPESTDPVDSLLHEVANPAEDYAVRVVTADEVRGLYASITTESLRLHAPGLCSSPKVTTLLAPPASGVARQSVLDVQATEPDSPFDDLLKLPDIAWVMEQPGGIPGLDAVTTTTDEQPRSLRGIILGFCPEELEDGRVRLAVAWYVHPAKPAKRGGILGLFERVPEDFSPWHGHLARELDEGESLLIGGRIPETREIFILIVEGERIEPGARSKRAGDAAELFRVIVQE